MAREREQPIVRMRVDRHRHGPERGDEPVHEPVPGRRRLRERGEEPGRALEELRARMFRAAGLGAADRMAADEAHAVGDGRGDAALGRADVGDRARLGARGERRGHLGDERRDGRGDDGELGALDSVLERGARV